jgi:prepilin-type N-terminal cleavage/methylation domain-containing protein
MDNFGLTTKNQPKRLVGFTLIELLIAIAVAGLIVGIGGVKYIEFNRSQTIVQAGATLVNNLRDIQARASSGVKPATAACNSNPLQAYRVEFYNNGGANCVSGKACLIYSARCNNSSENPQTINLAENVNYNTVPGLVDFKVLSQGTSVVSTYVIILQSPINSAASNQYYQKICISTSGEVKDCGYRKADSTFNCPC